MRSSFFLYILIVAFVAVSARKWKCESVAAPQCQAHATYNACGPNRFCYTTCGGPRGPPCLMDGCTAGCFCDEGYILNVSDGVCIKPEDCKAGFGH